MVDMLPFSALLCPSRGAKVKRAYVDVPSVLDPTAARKACKASVMSCPKGLVAPTISCAASAASLTCLVLSYTAFRPLAKAFCGVGNAGLVCPAAAGHPSPGGSTITVWCCLCFWCSFLVRGDDDDARAGAGAAGLRRGADAGARALRSCAGGDWRLGGDALEERADGVLVKGVARCCGARDALRLLA